MVKAFLSHSSVQKDFVRLVANELGHDHCILDEKSFESGMPTMDEIYRTIGSSDIFIFLISDSALKSEWVEKEVDKARKIIEENSTKRFHPFIIDTNIKYDNDRIPAWIRKNYILQQYDNPILLARRIKELIRQVVYSQRPELRIKEDLFIGRNNLLNDIESKLYTGDFSKKRSIIASGWEGSGRKKLLKTFLTQKLEVKEEISPIIIYLNARQSIEDFILGLNDTLLLYTKDQILEIVSGSKEEKIALAIKLINTLTDKKEIIFIKDRGAVVLPSKLLSQWFLDIIKSDKLDKRLCLFVIAQFRPVMSVEKNFPEIISIHVSPLTKLDQKKLFYAYCGKLKLEIGEEDAEFFIPQFSGQPEQILYTIDLIRAEGITYARKNIKAILDIGDRQVIVILDLFKQNKAAIDLLILLSRFEFISYDLLERIVGNSREVEDILEQFYTYSIFEHLGAHTQYLKLNTAISDYIGRSRMKLNPSYESRLKEISKEFLTSEKDYKLKDLSDFLYNVREAITMNPKFASKYIIPSFTLKTIVNLYYQSKWSTVIALCDKVLYDSNRFYEEIIRELRYWLCLALCRSKEETSRFFEEVAYFQGADKEFLLGFYYRYQKDFQRAKEHYDKSLEIADSAKARREKVIVLLGMHKYSDALQLAQENYEEKQTNTFHIEAYFKCLVRKPHITIEDRNILDKLINSMDSSYDAKKEEIKATMLAEKKFFIDKKVESSITDLQEIIRTSHFKYYAIKSLIDIYMRQANPTAANDLKEKYKTDLDLDNDDWVNER